MESDEIPNKRKRRLVTPSLNTAALDEECTEENIEGHAVVHLDLEVLHRIKQEPVDYSETPELTCVSLQQDFNDNSFQETFVDESKSNETENSQSNGNRATGSPIVPPVNENSVGAEQRLVNETMIFPSGGISSATATTRPRRSLRQRFSAQQRSHDDKEKSSTNYQGQSTSTQSPFSTRNSLSFRGVRRRGTSTVNQRVFQNPLGSQGRLGEIDTSDIISDTNDVFKRRFRKMLKDLVAKRMLKLQHSAVYSGTVSALRRKVAILERRNMQLEDKAERLQTSIMNLYNEKEKTTTTTLSRGTQVSMGMILSRAWSACQGAEKATPSASEEQVPLSVSEDGPVIVKVCGKQVNDASSLVKIPKRSPTVREKTSQQQVQQATVSLQSTDIPRTDCPLPKIQHVSSGNVFVPQQPHQYPCDPRREAFILPEHRLLGLRPNEVPISHGSTTRPLQVTNMPMPSSGMSNLPINCEVGNMTGQPNQLSGVAVPWPSNAPSYVQQHPSGPVHRIATVRPQQIIPSTANIPAAQNAQTPQPPLTQPTPVNMPTPRNYTVNISTAAEQTTPSVHHTDVPTSRSVLAQTQGVNALTVSMPSHAGRRRQPPGGYLYCPPNPNQRNAVGNQNPEQHRADLLLPRRCYQEGNRSQLYSKNQTAPSISTSRGSAQVYAPDLQPTVSLAYTQHQYFPVTQTPNRSQFSVSTEGPAADQIASTDPNHQYGNNFPRGQVDFPRSVPQAVHTIPGGAKNSHQRQPLGFPPPQRSSEPLPHQSEIQISSISVRNSVNQELSMIHQQESRRGLDQIAIPRTGIYMQPGSHPSQRQMYYSTNGLCSAQQHPQQQQQLLPQPQHQLHQQQVPLQLQKHQPHRQHHHHQQQQQQQQHQQQQQQQQPQPQPQLQRQQQQRAGYLQPPILPKPDSSAHQYWQHNPQFTTPSATHGGTFLPEHLVRFPNAANAGDPCLIQRPPGQTLFPRPCEIAPQNVRNEAYFHQQVQPQVHHNQSNVQNPSAPVGQLSADQAVKVLSNGLQQSQLTSLQRDSVGAGSLLPSQTPYSARSKVVIHSDASPLSLALLKPSDTDKNSTKAVRTIPPTASDKENGQLLARRASLSTLTMTTLSETLNNDFRSTPQSPLTTSKSLPNSQTKPLLHTALAPTARPERLGSAQGSELKSTEITPDKETCLVTTVSPGTGISSRSLPVQNLAGIKTSSATSSETEEYCKTFSNSHRDGTVQVETVINIGEQDDKEGPQLQTDSTVFSLKPVLGVEQSGNGIVLSWDLTSREDESKVIKYELYVTSAPSESTPSTNWEILGVVNALALPMACTMTQFIPGASYYFTVRAVTADGRSEMFSDPCSITVVGP